MDIMLKLDVHRELELMANSDDDNSFQDFEPDEVNAAINSLHLHKAAGPDGIQTENIRYGVLA